MKVSKSRSKHVLGNRTGANPFYGPGSGYGYDDRSDESILSLWKLASNITRKMNASDSFVRLLGYKFNKIEMIH